MNFLKKTIKQKLAKTVAQPPKVFFNIREIAAISQEEARFACHAACQATYLGDDTVLCRVLTKYLFYADARDIGITPHMCLNGFWEIWITQVFARIIQPGWNCVDIGANQGYFSILIADLIGASGRLLAVEPNPKLIDFLAKNLEVNGFQSYSTIRQQAVSDSDGEKLNLVIPLGRALNATITGAAAGENDTGFEVETASLDTLTEDWARVDFVKIDAEGAEEKIWRGMSKTIERNPRITIVMEFKCSRYSDPRSFLNDILKNGFELRHIDYDGAVKDLTLEQTLTERPDEDWMLFLQK
jgi:FkbM family methyltransferase